MAYQELFGIVAGVLSIPMLGLYIFAILKGTTKPNRVTWWILSLVSIAVLLSYHDLGARDTLWLPIVYTLGYVCTAILSLKYGDGPFSLSTLDRAALGGGIVSVALYWFAEAPLLALFFGVLTECIALIPTAVKSYTNPETEDYPAWMLGTIASLINLFAISEWSLAIAGYPVWVFVSNAFIVYFLIRGKRPFFAKK